jgi:energy-converting hydrogenase Eha subunit A
MDETTDRPAYEPELAQPPTPAPQTKYSAAQRVWTMFTSPGEVFSDIGIKPTWVLIMAVLVILMVAAQAVIMPHVDTEATLRARLESRGRELSETQMENAVKQAEKFSRFGPIVTFVVGPIAWVIMGAVFFLMLKLVGSEADYPRALSTTLHGYWPPTLVQLALTTILVQRVGKVPQDDLAHVVKANLGAFMSADTPAWLSAAAGTISVFNIWAVVLLIIGFAAVGKLSRGKAAAVVLVPWILWLVAKAGLTAVFS